MKYNVLYKALEKTRVIGNSSNFSDIMVCSSLCDYLEKENLLKNRLSESLNDDLTFLVDKYDLFSNLKDDLKNIDKLFASRNIDVFYKNLKEEVFIGRDDNSENADILEIISSNLTIRQRYYEFLSKKRFSSVISSWLTEDKTGLSCYCPFNSMLDIEKELSVNNKLCLAGSAPNVIFAKKVYLCCLGNKTDSSLLIAPEQINTVDGSFDIGFSFPPLAMRLGSSGDTFEMKLMEDMLERISGRFCVISFSGLSNSSSRRTIDFRKKIIKSGRLLAIAELPSGFIPTTGVSCTAWFFDCEQKEQKQVSFVDISRPECKDTKNSGRFLFEFNEYAIDSLKQCLSGGDSELIEKISTNEISKDGFILTPSRYVLPKEVKEAKKKILEGDTKLCDIAEFFRTLPTKPEERGEPYFEVSASDINSMGVIETPSKQILKTEENVAKRNLLEKGDIIFAIKGSVGKVGLVAEEHSNWLLNQSFVIIRVKNQNWPVEYVFRQLKSSAMKYYIQSMTIGSVIPSLAMSDLKNIMIVSPDRGHVDDQIKKHERQIELTQKIKELQQELNELNNF